MPRYEKINALARAWATPTFGAGPRVHEWEVRMFDAHGAAANSAFYTSKRDALADMEREAARGRQCSGPFPVSN